MCSSSILFKTPCTIVAFICIHEHAHSTACFAMSAKPPPTFLCSPPLVPATARRWLLSACAVQQQALTSGETHTASFATRCANQTSKTRCVAPVSWQMQDFDTIQHVSCRRPRTHLDPQSTCQTSPGQCAPADTKGGGASRSASCIMHCWPAHNMCCFCAAGRAHLAHVPVPEVMQSMEEGWTVDLASKRPTSPPPTSSGSPLHCSYSITRRSSSSVMVASPPSSSTPAGASSPLPPAASDTCLLQRWLAPL